MKTKLIFTAFFLFFTLGTSFAQRTVYVDTEYILDKLPQYDEAQKTLEAVTKQWQEEISTQETAFVEMKTSFETNKALMPENLKIKEENNIAEAQKQLSDLKRKRFGVRGDLFQKQQELIQPIQDGIYNAIKKMAEQRDYDFVLDKSTGVSILFVKPKFDMSDEVLRILNISLDN